ncbi:MAG: ATP-binding protein [Treponema sp.]|nr:ATP-binding protein [Treponema sp.]
MAQVQETQKQRDSLLDTVNQVAEVLLTASIEDSPKSLMMGMELVGRCLNVDRVQIWRNEVIDDELHFVMRYEWLSEVGKQKIEVPIGLKSPYSRHARWYKMFLEGGHINTPISLLPEEDAAFLGYYEMVSIVILPLFINQEFIGFFSVDDCVRERVFSADEMDMLGSTGLMFTSVFNRNLQAEQIAETNRRLEGALEHALYASRAKTEFLAKMSHEIRTPMNAIIGMAELALRADKLETIQEYVLTVKQAGTNLLAIINDILDISKIEKGKLEILPVDYHFSSLLNDVISIIRMRVLDSRLRFVVNVDGNIPNSLRGDEIRIRQVLLNLLTNSVKYTDSGGFVSLCIRGEMEGEDLVNLTIDVEDSGRGIKKEDLDNLFDEYTQFEREKNKWTEGTGLGLAIVSHIVKAMDGKISVRSEYGKGSTFTVTFPQKVRAIKSLGGVENVQEKNVLMYEEREIYANSLLFALDSLGTKCTTVPCDADLLEKLAKGKYAFAFISFELYQKNIGALMEMDTETKVVILTEFGETVPEKNLTVLAMPVHSLSVANILNGAQENFSYHGNVGFAVGFTAPDANILVVDDVLTNLKVVKGLLAPYGMQVSLCKSGAMALDAIKASRYDIVFMDHLMPGMDGIEATAQIRKFGSEDSYFAEVPIVALTANAVSGAREFFMENGFSDFMSKPVDVVKLNTVLERWIPKTKRRKLATKEELL